MHFALLIVALLSVSFNSYGYEDTQIFEAISIVDTNITKLGGIVDGQTTAINEHATRIEKLTLRRTEPPSNCSFAPP